MKKILRNPVLRGLFFLFLGFSLIQGILHLGALILVGSSFVPLSVKALGIYIGFLVGVFMIVIDSEDIEYFS
jgi:hypothetical protein